MTEDDDVQAFSNALFGRSVKPDDAPDLTAGNVAPKEGTMSQTGERSPDSSEFLAEFFGGPDNL